MYGCLWSRSRSHRRHRILTLSSLLIILAKVQWLAPKIIARSIGKKSERNLRNVEVFFNYTLPVDRWVDWIVPFFELYKFYSIYRTAKNCWDHWIDCNSVVWRIHRCSDIAWTELANTSWKIFELLNKSKLLMSVRSNNTIGVLNNCQVFIVDRNPEGDFK